MRIWFFIILFIIFSPYTAFAEANIKELSLNDATVFDAVQLLSRRAGVNVIFSGDKTALADKRITLHLEKADPLQVIEQILRSNGFSFEKRGNIITVSTLPADLGSTAYESGSQIVYLNHLSPKKLADLIGKMGLGVTAFCEESSNTLLIRGKGDKVAKARQLISSLDQPLPKVFLKAEIIEVSTSGMERLGIYFGAEQSGFSFSVDKDDGSVGRDNDFNLILSALIASGEARLLARPSLTVLNGEEAEINIGSRLPFAVPSSSSNASTLWAVEYIDAGVNLKILPYVSQDNIITAKIISEVSSIAEWKTTAAGEFPVLSTRNASTTLTVRNGETIAIAGLISEQERENKAKLPILGDLPFLGWLFQYTTNERARNEIVFLITPTILY